MFKDVPRYLFVALMRGALCAAIYLAAIHSANTMARAIVTSAFILNPPPGMIFAPAPPPTRGMLGPSVGGI